jgi:hypothetical protein
VAVVESTFDLLFEFIVQLIIGVPRSLAQRRAL